MISSRRQRICLIVSPPEAQVWIKVSIVPQNQHSQNHKFGNRTHVFLLLLARLPLSRYGGFGKFRRLRRLLPLLVLQSRLAQHLQIISFNWIHFKVNLQITSGSFFFRFCGASSSSCSLNVDWVPRAPGGRYACFAVAG